MITVAIPKKNLGNISQGDSYLKKR